MVVEKRIPPNPHDQIILKNIEDLLEIKLEQVAEIRFTAQSYSVNEIGAVNELSLSDCGIDTQKLQMLVAILPSLTNLTQLDLWDNHFDDISELAKLKNLTSLDLGFNNITDISVLKELPNLTQLDLRGNQLTDISILSRLSNLTQLILSYNKLTDLSVLIELPNLTQLNLRDNQLANISVLAGLPNLTQLDLSNNKLTDLSVLKGLPNLTQLDLGYNKLHDLSVLATLKNLTSLDLSLNNLIDISVLAELSNLTQLDLSNNQLTDLSVIKDLPNLTQLNLSDNRFTDISVLRGLPNLTLLNLSYNKLTDISVLAGLTNLIWLYLRCNWLTDISVLVRLPKLAHLNLSDNKLTDLSVLKKLPNLTLLNLSENKLTDLSVLKGLSNIMQLYLGHAKLVDISALTELPNLTGLGLNDNQLTDISALAGLPNLTRLDLSNNQLTDISALAGLPNLTRLDLSNNKLENIPSQFFSRVWQIHLKNTFHSGINLFGNPLKTPPMEIVQKGRKAVLSYFASLEGDKKKLNEVKVLLVGAGGSGKTSLLKRIFSEPFDEKESQTKGILIRNKPYRKAGQTINAHFWDFGGQVIMHSSHQFFLSQRSLYILVLDGRKEEDAEHWLQLIESFGGNSPILVVLNKMDENPSFEVNRRFLQDKYKRILGFYRVSCKDDMNNGINGKAGLIEGIRNAFDEVEMIGTEWGESWFNVKKELEKIKTGADPFLDSTTYQKICEKARITETEDMETLVDYLNDLGVILHFKDLGLADMHVLDPHWVTDAVYRIINSKKLADNHGELHADDLKGILKKRKSEDFSYPTGKYHYILKLMGKFELCYRMADDSMLVPDLQDVQEPKMPSFGDSSLQFYFSYSYLPSSVLPRFTVRMHDEILDDLRWRTGLVIRNNDFNATAVIKSDADRKRIYIEVYGNQKREYFSCIRREFFRIHDGFKKFGVTQWILLPDDTANAVTYENLYGHWKAGKTDYFHGETGRSYSVNKLLDGIETKEERLASLLHSIGFKANDIKGQSPETIFHIFVQNIIGDVAKGMQVGEMRDYNELFKDANINESLKILESKQKG
jgi:internalin A